MRHRYLCFLFLVPILMISGVALAQPDRGPGGPPPPDRERIQTIIIGKFAAELDLTPEQGEKFYPRLRKFHNQAEEFHKRDRDLREQMDALSRDSDADQAKVQSLLDSQKDQDHKMSDLKREFLSDVSGFLSPQQVSKCSILLDEMPRRIREFIEMRRAGGGGPGPDAHGFRPGGPRRRGY